MKKKRKNRRILYALVGLLVVAGAMAGVAAKETASVYDAPDLHLTQGSEKYDLTEGITYDSGKYELAVKDTGDFDINIIGEYQVGYTLTPKGAETTGEEGETAAQSTGEQSAGKEAAAEQSAQADEAAAENGEAAVATQEAVAEQSAQADEAAAENGDAAVTTQEAAAEQSAQADEAAAENGDAAVTTQEADGRGETILFKRTVFVDAEVVDGYYLYAPALEVEAGSTDYNLLDGVELRKADTDEKVADAKIKVEDASNLESGVMTAEELAAYNNETEAGETEAAEEGTGAQDETEDTTEHPALKEGTYEVTIEAENPETEETLYVAREIRAVYKPNGSLMEVYDSSNKLLGTINTIGVNQYSPYHRGNIGGPTEITWSTSPNFPVGVGHTINVYGYYPMQSRDSLEYMIGFEGQRIAGSAPAPDGSGTLGVDKWEAAKWGDWSKFGRGTGVNGTPDVTVKFINNVPKANLEFGSLSLQIKNYNTLSSMTIDGQGNPIVTPDANDAAQPRFYWAFPPGMQVALKNIYFYGYMSNNIDTNKNALITLNGNYLKLENLTGIASEPDNHLEYRMASSLYIYPLNYSTVELVGGAGGQGQQLYYVLQNSDTATVIIRSSKHKTSYFSPALISSAKKLKLVSLQEQPVRLYLSSATNVEMEGPIYFDNKNYHHFSESFVAATSRGNFQNVVLTGNTTIHKSSKNRDANLAAINDIKSFVSDGYKISGQGNGFALKNNELFAKGTTAGVLDATDFYVANPDEKKTEVPGRLYFTSAENGTKIKTTQLDTEPIEVVHPDGIKKYYQTYEDALKKDDMVNAVDGTYIIRNRIERDFTSQDNDALKAFHNTNVKLVFESGDRGADNPDGAAETRYRIRMKVQTLQLPAGVEVTFQNIVLKYAEGTHSEIKDAKGNDVQDLVFVNNGGKLTFGENVKFLAGDNNAEGVPTVYGGAEGTNCDKKAILTFQSGKYTAVYGGNKGEGSHTAEAVITVEKEATVTDTLSGGGDAEQTKAADKTAEITVNNALTVKNIYDYDKLTIEKAITVTSTMNSEQGSKNYKGETLLAEGASFKLINAEGTKTMGSLKMKEGAEKNATLRLVRAAEKDGKNASNKENPYILTLTGTNPMKSQKGKIDVAYESGTETDNDIVFYLPNAASDTEVSCEPLKSSFSLAMREKPRNRTIRIYDETIAVFVGTGTKPEIKVNLAETIDYIAEQEKAKPGVEEYTISIFKEGYTIDADDIKALKDIRDDKSSRVKAQTAKKIVWTSKKDKEGNPLKTAATVIVSDNLCLFGRDEIILEDLILKGKQAYNIYANGTPLTVNSGVTIQDKKASLYGGSEDAKQQGKTITVNSNAAFQDVKDFTELTIGNGQTTKYTLSVYGKLDSNPEKKDNTRTGIVSLKNGELKFAGATAGHIGKLISDANSNSINIYKDAAGTKPLKLDGKVTLDGSNKKIELKVNDTGESSGDIVLEFADANNAISSQYTNTKMSVRKEGAKIVLNLPGKYLVVSESIIAEINTIIDTTNLDRTDTLYYLSKYKNGNFDNDPDWRNFGTREGEADVTIIPLKQQPNGDELQLQTLKNQIAGMDENSSVLFNYTKDEEKGNGWNLSAGTYQIPNMYITFRMAAYDNAKFNVTEAGGTLFWERCYLESQAITDEPFPNYEVSPAISFSGKKLDTLKYLFSQKKTRAYSRDRNFTNVAEHVIYSTMDDYAENNTIGSILGYNQMVVDTAKKGKLHLSAMTGARAYNSPYEEKAEEFLSPNTTSRFEIRGTGELWQDAVQTSGDYGRSNIVAATFVVNGEVDANGNLQAPTIYKGMQRQGYGGNIYGGGLNRNRLVNIGVIGVSKEYISNGYKLIIKAGGGTSKDKRYSANFVERELRWGSDYFGEVIADASKSGILDPTDFDLQSLNHKEKKQYLTSAKDGTQVIVTQLAKDGIIQVDPAVNGKSYFATYKDAFEAIQNSDKKESYTISNILETNFTKEDQEALKKVTTEKVASLTFKSGARTDKDGAAGNRYRVRMRVQNLELPEGVNVTFQNIVMKYDQGTNTEAKNAKGDITSYEMTFAGNGGTLTFGDGVVFLKHNDETMKPTVYGGSTTKAIHQKSTVTVTAGCNAHFTAIYGGGTKAQTGNASVAIYGGTVDKVFGGGKTAEGTVNGDTQLKLTGGTCNSTEVYGGGEDAKVEGSTDVEVDVKLPNNASVYGGSKNAQVTKNTNVWVKLPNTNTAHEFRLKNISAYGTDNNGELADNVGGTRAELRLEMKDKTLTGSNAVIESLSGFSSLTIGADTDRDFNNSKFIITKRFDSKPTGSAAAGRTDTVVLHSSQIVLNGAWKGHIGSLQTNGTCSLSVHKTGTNDTYPLLVDGTVLAEKEGATTKQIHLKTTYTAGQMNEMGDVILTFTTPANADKTQYVDGSGMNMEVAHNQTKGTIFFKNPKAHTVESWIEYPTNTVLDKNATMAKKKIMHFVYDKENNHEVAYGYVVRMKKADVTKNLTDEQRKRYTDTDSQFVANGTFSKAFTDQVKEGNYWEINWTIDKNNPGKNGAHGADGVTKPVAITEEYWYIAHVVCANGDWSTSLVDVNAPTQKTADTTVKLLDTAGGADNSAVYEFTLTIADPTVNDKTHLTPLQASNQGNDRLEYSANGVAKAYWAIGGLADTDNQNLMNVAAKRAEELIADELAKGGLTEGSIKADVAGAEENSVTQGNTGKVIVKIPEATMLKAKAAGKKAVMIFVKDGVNNTVQIPIPVDENIIDVKVPTKVSVVAVKKASGTPELLAPTCYVYNNGGTKVKAEVAGFAVDQKVTQSTNLHLVNKSGTFNSNEIALYLKAAGETNKAKMLNVMELSNKTRFTIGSLENNKATDLTTRSGSFTFDADYDVQNINVPDTSWNTYQMSYHFTIEN